jgi:hypothetical protein
MATGRDIPLTGGQSVLLKLATGHGKRKWQYIRAIVKRFGEDWVEVDRFLPKSPNTMIRTSRDNVMPPRRKEKVTDGTN